MLLLLIDEVLRQIVRNMLNGERCANHRKRHAKLYFHDMFDISNDRSSIRSRTHLCLRSFEICHLIVELFVQHLLPAPLEPVDVVSFHFIFFVFKIYGNKR